MGWLTDFFTSLAWLFKTPPTPSGPSTAAPGEVVIFAVRPHTDLHPYRFDWGDSFKGDWGGPEQKHMFLVPGTFPVRARQRCPIKWFTSKWSDPAAITIVAAPICGPSAS